MILDNWQIHFEKMRSEMKELIGEVKSEALEITGMVQEIDASIRALDDQIENVSATTEELGGRYGGDSGIFGRDKCNVT